MTEDELREIERARKEGRSGPILGRYVDLLLEDRREMTAKLSYIRERVRQAAAYLDGLFEPGHQLKRRAVRRSARR